MIGPGIPNPMMLAGGDPLDELGKIERSVRFRAYANAHLTRVLASAGNRKTWSIRFCAKVMPTSGTWCFAYAGGGVDDEFEIESINGALVIYGKVASVAQVSLTTAALFRDPAAHYDFQVDVDTTQAVAADRVKVFCNGVQITAFSSATYPAQNADLYWNHQPYTANIGRFRTTYYFDGYLSSFCFVDGKTVGPTAFGAFHPRTGQWRPKSKAAIRAAVAAGGGARNGWGTNGFFLPFDDTSSVPALGYDRSQSDTDTSGNNWTPTNISLTAGWTYDSFLDTPTNNFPTFNMVTGYYAAVNYAATHYATNLAANGQCVTTMPIPARGKWYWEIRFETYAGGSGPRAQLGMATAKSAATNGYDTESYGVDSLNGNKYYNGAGTAYCGAITAGTVVGFLADADAGTLSLTKNGVDQGVAWSGIDFSRGFFPAVADAWATLYGSDLYLNCGQQPWAYSPPAGYKAICTKNLAFPPIARPSSAFVEATDTGANIQATLAALRSGWSAYIEIFKRRDATAEGWRWRFSDDSANYLDSSSTAAKAAFPSLAGTSYVGYALKVAAANGVATGRLTHVNGAADVVSDGLATARKMVILKNEATGSWYVYHPELTAGKLLYLEQKTIETTDATISAVTASGFTVAAALASGTYRWVALAEIDGFLKLWKSIGNGVSLDGQFLNAGMAEAFDLCKRADDAAPWSAHDSLRSANPNVLDLQFNATQGENGLADPDPANIDQISNGKKVRTNTGDSGAGYSNASNGVYVGLSIAAFPFRYANAR